MNNLYRSTSSLSLGRRNLSLLGEFGNFYRMGKPELIQFQKSSDGISD